VQVFSFPADRVGEPKISQVATGLGSGDTRFWSVKNLSAIPDEPHAPPFEDLSVMTAFVAREMFYEKTDWNGLATEFWKSYLDKGSIKKSRVEELGFFPTKAPVKLDRVDSLYTALRKAIVLKPVNEVYPLVDELNDVFEKKSGDASDLAAIFYKILQDWDVDASGVWLRDRREGTFESSAPMVRWFDRIGVLVKIGETEKLYDFDRAIASSFSTPWFLKGITALVIGKSGCRSITTPASKPGETWIREAHELKFGDRFAIRDSMVTSGLGGPVEEWRHDGYELKGTELQSYLQRVASAKCIEGAAEICHSQLLDEREVTVAITGSSKSAVTVIDNFVSVRPANNLLKALYEELYAPVRTNAVVLEEPYTMTVEWMIHHPSGYVLAETPKDTTLEGFSGAQGSMACERVGDDAHLTAKLDLKTQVVPVSDYSNLIRVLNGLQRASERAVTFKKK
jgi:hypothetical protein